jgi:Icc protein
MARFPLFLAAAAAAGGASLLAGLNGGAQADFRFAILGDRTGRAQAGVYEQVWREIDAERPDFVVNVGDTIEGGNDATVESEWDGLRPLFQRYSRYPLYFTPGNHDIWSPKSRRVYERETGRPPHYGFDYGGAHFTVLDNSQSDELTAGELDFLEKDLAGSAARNPKFVFFHQPSWLIPVLVQNPDTRLHRIASKYGVTHIVSGHVHKFGRFEMDGIVYLLVGSSGARLRGASFEDGWFYHHVLATVRGGEVVLEVKETGRPFGQGRSFRARFRDPSPVVPRSHGYFSSAASVARALSR